MALKRLSTNALGQTKATFTNARGQTTKVVDALTGTITYTYDVNGNLTQLNANSVLSSIGYDALDRKTSLNDPDQGNWTYSYNAHGYTHKLVEASNPTHVYQQLNATNARGQTTSQSLHDGQFQLADSYNAQTGLVSTIQATSNYTLNRTLLDINLTFDTQGNLTGRTRNVQSQGNSPVLPAKTLTEAFTYDQLNRLTAIAPSGSATQNMTYDLKGNLTSKTGVGSYSYNPSRPHAVSAAGSDTFTYDAIGNMTSGGGRTVAYNAFRKPTTITKGTHSTSFEYGPVRSHKKRVDNTGVNITRTLTVGNVEYIKIDAGPTKTKRYIGSHIVVTDFNGTHEEHALLTDHLGSTVVMAKANSLDTSQQDCDAFGKRRNLWTAQEELAAEKIIENKLTTTGFTGHEMLDEVGLIHMGGRVYDPNLGRFLSADPYITELDNTQNMNRYSYVHNNPLTWMDPDGFNCEGMMDCDFSGGSSVGSNVGITISIGTGGTITNIPGSLFEDTCCFEQGTIEINGPLPDVNQYQVNVVNGGSGVAAGDGQLIVGTTMNATELLNVFIATDTTVTGSNSSGLDPVATRECPLSNCANISSEFKDTDRDCGTCSQTHLGTDYTIPVGTPVFATAAGTVARANTATGYGLVVIIDHGPSPTDPNLNVYTLYAHASSLSVEKDDSVTIGQTIMLSGTTAGQSGGGAHLHYEVIATSFTPNQSGFYGDVSIRFSPSELDKLLNRR